MPDPATTAAAARARRVPPRDVEMRSPPRGSRSAASPRATRRRALPRARTRGGGPAAEAARAGTQARRTPRTAAPRTGPATPRSRRGRNRGPAGRAGREPQGLRRQRPAREDVDVLPGVAERDLRVQQRLDDPVELPHPRAGPEPVEDTAEVDEADAVLARQVALAQRSSGANRLVERPVASLLRLGEAVEEQDHVGVPLGMELVDPELAATRARPPVDPPDAIPGCERPQVCELDPFALLPRHSIAREDLRLAWRDQLAKRLRTRIDAQRRGSGDGLLPGEEARCI